MIESIVIAVVLGSIALIGINVYIHYRFKKSITDVIKDTMKFDD